MADIKLTQAQFEAIPLLANQTPTVGLILKKLAGADWYRVQYVSEAGGGTWNINFDRILIDNRSRNVLLGNNTLDTLQAALRQEVIDGSLTAANAAVLFSYVSDVILGLSIGWIRESRIICNNLATTTQFTTGRKNFMLARIDEAIALI